MTNAYTVILNPFADRGRTGQKREQVEAALTTAGLTFELQETAGRLSDQEQGKRTYSGKRKYKKKSDGFQW